MPNTTDIPEAHTPGTAEYAKAVGAEVADLLEGDGTLREGTMEADVLRAAFLMKMHQTPLLRAPQKRLDRARVIGAAAEAADHITTLRGFFAFNRLAALEDLSAAIYAAAVFVTEGEEAAL
jgi:hypothetical protein